MTQLAAETTLKVTKRFNEVRKTRSQKYNTADITIITVDTIAPINIFSNRSTMTKNHYLAREDLTFVDIH
jgi:hypothetical protein